MDNNIYNNPLITRYSSAQMSQTFSEKKRITQFRKLWVALAESERELGINITQTQIDSMKEHIEDIDFETAAEQEKKVRHDVMAHVYAYGLQCPEAKPIIHLGATSCFVTDNADIIIYRDAIEIIEVKLVSVMKKLADFAQKYKNLPTLGFTHLQPAQLVTVGKRACLWLQDLYLDYQNLMFLKKGLMLRGVKGTTGTQASFMELFDNDNAKVKQLEKLVVQKMGFNKAFAVSGQTYTRKLDYNITSLLSQIAQSGYKFSNDLRILQNMKEIEEPFEKNQIGSSAMAYKRNPMRSERLGSLARYVVSLPLNTALTASTQWLERTLDDSANRRIVMAQAFMGVDAILELYLNIVDGMVVYKKIIEKHIKAELPFMATENILMECVKNGGDRQELHEIIRKHSMLAAEQVKVYGKDNDLIKRIKADEHFAVIKDSIDAILKPKNFIGRAPAQVNEFLASIKPLLKKYSGKLTENSDTIKV